MKKGISPLIASVLLIAITIAIAAILASWVTKYTQEALPTKTCVGGSMAFVSSEYPKYNSDKAIVACIEAQYVDLADFKIEVLFNNDTVKTFDVQETDTTITAGSTGCVRTANGLTIETTAVKKVRILTGCSNVNIEGTLK